MAGRTDAGEIAGRPEPEGVEPRKGWMFRRLMQRWRVIFSEVFKKQGSVNSIEASKADFENVIFPAEFREIWKRRTVVDPNQHPEADVLFSVKPSVKLGLVGLALSGGGIRSATFNLGVLQAFAKHGLLCHVDYLSTVSGGGYIGSFLSSLFSKRNAEKVCKSTLGGDAVFGERVDGREPDVTATLRRANHYLAPKGMIDYLKIPALLFKGIILHFLTLVPYVVASVWLTYLAFLPHLHVNAAGEVTYGPVTSFLLPLKYIGIAFFAIILATPIINLRRGRYATRNALLRIFGVLLMSALIISIIAGLFSLLLYYHRAIDDQGNAALWARVFRAVNRLDFWSLLAGVIPFLMADQGAKSISRLRGKILIGVLGFLGPVILIVFYLTLGNWGVFHEIPNWAQVHWMSSLFAFAHEHLGVSAWTAFTLLSGVMFLYTTLFLDLNDTSLHNFYRDRLGSAFLFTLDKDKRKVRNDDVKLSALNNAGELGALGPYHIINCAANIPPNATGVNDGRKLDFFFFSKLYCGGPRTGYCETKDLEKCVDGLDLGTAMAISGAAISPNDGNTKNKPLSFIMAILNVRLGYWLPKTGIVAHQKLFKNVLRIGIGPVLLFADLFNLPLLGGLFLNLSDGGHVENLGIYELLRRRCRFIIASDAEADPDMIFPSLAALIMHARRELGIQIEVPLEEIRKDAEGISRNHSTIGKIRYPDGETGFLLYIKASVTGSEIEYIRQYRIGNPDFPHQATSDQFYTDAQFECYRCLGFSAADALFEQRLEARPNAIEKFFEQLKNTLQPPPLMDDAMLALHDRLSELEKRFQDPDLIPYTRQIFPEWDGARSRLYGSESASSFAHPGDILDLQADPFHGVDAQQQRAFQKAFHLCREQLQFMESVYLAARLDDPENRDLYVNRGWMNLFRRWSQAPFMRRCWAVNIPTLSMGFQRFCEDALKFETGITWYRPDARDLTPREIQLLQTGGLDGFLKPDARARGHLLLIAHRWVKVRHVESDTKDMGPSKEGFPIGIVAVKMEGPKATLVYYRIRDYYRKMRLLDPMLETLCHHLRTAEEKYDIAVEFPGDSNGKRIVQQFGYVFHSHEIRIKEPVH